MTVFVAYQVRRVFNSKGVVQKMNEQKNMQLSERNSLYMCLCTVCLGQFYTTNSFFIFFDNMHNEKERCDFCNYRYGYDYIMRLKRSKKRTKGVSDTYEKI